MSEYKVIKETYAYRFCNTCQGAGWKKRRFKGHEMKEVCVTCRGTGKQKLTHRTEVSLEEALHHIGAGSGVPQKQGK